MRYPSSSVNLRQPGGRASSDRARTFLRIRAKTGASSLSRSFCAAGRTKSSYTALLEVHVQRNSLLIQLAQVFQIHEVFFELFSGELFEDGFFDEKSILQSSFPAEMLDPLGDGIHHLHGQSGFCFFHGAPMME